MDNNAVSALLIAAGISRRFRDQGEARYGTKYKQLIKIGRNGETLLDLVILETIKSGIYNILIVVGRETEAAIKELVKAHYHRLKNVKFTFITQSYNVPERTRPWGTADAVTCALPYLTGPVIISNSDDLYLDGRTQLRNALQNGATDAILGYPLDLVVPEVGEVNRGIISTVGDHAIAIDEHLAISRADIATQRGTSAGLTLKSVCSMNLLTLSRESVAKMSALVNTFKKEHAGDPEIECYLPVVLTELMQKKQLSLTTVNATQPWIGISTADDVAAVMNELKQYGDSLENDLQLELLNGSFTYCEDTHPPLSKEIRYGRE